MAFATANSLTTGDWHKKAMLVLLLLSLLLQVQPVYACVMMEHSGPSEHCCCEEMAVNKQTDQVQATTPGCCEISSQLTFKASDTEDQQAVAITSPSSREIPVPTLVLILVSLWPEILVAAPSLQPWHFDVDPDDPATPLYLSTQRLRI